MSESEDSELEVNAGENSATRCIIHVPESNGADSKVIKWSDETWRVVLKCTAIRKSSKQFLKSKYFGVIDSLPERPGKMDGYHSRCYKNFTATSKTHIDSATPNVDRVLRSECSSTVSSGTKDRSVSDILPEKCLFCDKKVRQRPNGTKEYLSQILTRQGEETITEIVQTLRLTKVLVKIGGVDLIAKEAKLHNSCRSEYQLRAKRIRNMLETIPEEGDSSVPFKSICSYVKEYIIENKRPEHLISIYERYTVICEELETLPPITKVQHFGNMLKKEFPNDLILQSSDSRKSGTIVYNKELDYSSICTVYNFKSSPEGQVIQAALLLRQAIKSVNKERLSEPLTLESLKRGEGDPPELVRTFYHSLLAGSGCNEVSASTNRRINSLSQDVLFAVRGGNLKPRKHILTAIAIKSLTGSKKVLTMLNKLGHCINYNATEELETELAYGILEKQQFRPTGSSSESACGLAFDNYDELTHTLSGADTLHDTQGIFYQAIQTGATNVNVTSNTPAGNTDDGSGEVKTRPRRSLCVRSKTLEPYRKKPRMTAFSYNNLTFRCHSDSSPSARMKDLLFLCAHAFDLENIPLWVGFMSYLFTDHLPKQVVHYMPNMESPPSSNEVIIETLKLTQACAMECGQEYGVVTYDLDVAKNATRIQITEKPMFDNVFILFGSFHLMMCLFRSIGKLIDESGLPEMLTDSYALATGSMNGFINCTNFNRCKRLHPMLSLALEILHFQNFFENYEQRDDVKDLIVTYKLTDSTSVGALLGTRVFEQLFKTYSTHVELTLNGNHGETAQFIYEYIERVHVFQLLDRAVRECDIDLYCEALTPAIDLFFATNRVNYARWMTKHQLDLINLPQSHPGLKELLESGLFSIRRTDHNFSRSAVDLTLEQTVNADSASRMTGYTAATNNYTARLRWSITKGSRAALISAAFDMTDMNRINDMKSEIRPSRVKRDISDLKNLISTIRAHANPFSLDTDSLINISTGKLASREIRDSMMNIKSIGKQLHDNFVKECSDDPVRFELTISKNKLKTFANQGAKNSKAQNAVVQELRCTRDMLGRIAIIATKRKVDLEFILQFPLTPVPLSICKTDGSMVHTDKSVLFALLEKRVAEHGQPKDIKTYVIDGNFLLHCLPPNLPPTYAGLSCTVLHLLLSHKSGRIDIVFDTYEEPSIKDSERNRRGSEETQYIISGPEQLRPKDFSKALKSASFKKQLPKFLAKDWCNEHYSNALSGKQLYLGFDNECIRFEVVGGKVVKQHVQRLACNHPEADTRICLHIIDSDTNGARGDVVIRAADTDIMVILLHHASKVASSLWMDVGTLGRGNRRFVNVTEIAADLGNPICSALPGFHAFSGCDYTSAFSRKGKKRPFMIMEKDPQYISAFSDLTSRVPKNETYEILEDYTCAIYGARKSLPLNQHRYRVFEKAYGPKDKSKLLSKLKGVDASSIPPCRDVLHQKIVRSNFVALMWHSALLNDLPKTPNGGWELVDGFYQLVWFRGPQMPTSVVPDEPGYIEEDSDDDERYLLADSESDSDTDQDE